MPPIAPERMTDAQREAVRELLAGRRGALFGPFIPALRSPEFMRRLQKLGEYLRYDHALEPRLREMVILLTAREWTQEYEWDVHAPIAVEAGLAPATVTAIAEGRRPDAMPEDETLVYDFCRELQRNRRVGDATYTRAVAAFGEPGVIDLVGAVGYYTTLAMIMNVAQTPLPDGKFPVLPALPR
jgi:4-carboxymuconolactone decarboxylase